MKFSINQSELQNAIATVSKGVSTRSTLPVLSGILVEAINDELVLQSTDLELSIQYAVPALVEEEGRIVFPCKLFQDIVKSLPDAAVSITADEEGARISCDKSAFSIKTLSAEDFPSFPHVDVKQQIHVPFTKFSSMVRKVARTVSRDESRAILTGVLITLEDGVLKMVATDSYRLAVTQAEVEGEQDNFSAVISGNFLSDIAALSKSEEPITLALADNQIVVSYMNTVFINRRIEGNYPNYKQLIPSSYVTRVGVSTSELIAAVKRTSLLGSSGAPVKMAIDVESGELTLSATTQDVGSARETLSMEGTGDSLEIAFNCTYVLDGLSSVDGKNVYIETQSPLKPGIFKAEDSENFLYLVMPVRIA